MKKHLLFLTLAAVISLLPFGAKAQDTITIGNGTSATYYPLPGFYGWQYDVYIYTPTDAEELDESIVISSIGFDATTTNSSTGASWEIWLKDVDANYTLAAATTFTDFTTDATLVHSNTAFSSTTGWNTFQLSDDFIHEGGNALLVIVRGVGCTTSGGCSRQCHYTSVTGTHWYKHSDSNDPGTSVSGTVDANRANIQITYDLSGGDICRKPNQLSVSDINENGATVSWHTRNGETQWNVYLNGQLETTVYDSSYTFASLTPNTLYTAGIQAICTDTVSGISSISFRTSCPEVFTLPLIEGFESYSTGSGNRPDCWTVVQEYTSGSTHYPYVSTTSHSGSRAFYMYANKSTSAEHPNTIVSPLLSTPLNQLHVEFWMRGSSSGTFIMGVTTDLTDTHAYTPLITIGNSTTTYQHYEIWTDSIAALASMTDTGYVFFHWQANGNSSYAAYLDDILIEVASPCRRPIEIVLDSVGMYEATLTWTPNPYSTATTGYEVLYAKANNTEDSTAITEMVVGDTTITLDGLDPNTTYYTWIRTLCGTEDHTLWFQGPTFTTNRTCYVFAHGYIGGASYNSVSISWEYDTTGRGYDPVSAYITLEDQTDTNVDLMEQTIDDGFQTFFTGLEPGHTYSLRMQTICSNGDTSNVMTGTVNTSSCGEIKGNSYGSYVPFYGLYNYAYTQALYPLSTTSGMDSIRGVAYRLYSTPSSYPDRIVDIYIGRTLMTNLTTTSYVPVSNLTLVASNDTLDVSHTGWSTIMFDSAWYVDPTAAGDIVVAVVNKTGHYSSFSWYVHEGSSVYWYQDGSAINPASPSATSSGTWAYAPDIRFVGDCDISCYPANLATLESDANSVTLTVAPGADESSWSVQYHPYGDNEWIDAEDAEETTFTVDGLEPATRYYFRVGVTCDDGSIIWSNTVNRYTGCADMEVPYFVDFEQYNTSEVPLCWTSLHGSAGYTNTSSSYTANGSSRSLQMYASGEPTYFISQLVPVEANNLEVIFSAAVPAAARQLEVGLMTDPTDTTTFLPILTVMPNANTSTEYFVTTDTVVGAPEEAYVAFRLLINSSAVSAYLDDISIDVNTGCTKPRSLHVSGEPRDTQVTLAWIGNPDVNYDVLVGTINNIDSATITQTVTGDTTIILSGLTPSTNYYAWVRANCGENTSRWTRIAFATACGIMQMPYEENFNNITNVTQLRCWDRYTGLFDTAHAAISSTTSGWLYNTNSMDGSPHVKVNVYGTTCKYWLVTPAVHVEPGAALLFDVTVTDYGNSSAPDPVGPDDRFVVAATVDSGEHWIPLYQFGGVPTRDDEEYTNLNEVPRNMIIPLGVLTNQDARFAFYGESTVSGGDNDLHIDNIQVISADCLRPSITNADVTAYTIDVNWHNNSLDPDPEGFEVILSPTDDPTDTNAVHIDNTIATHYLFTGLTPTTDYYIFVRALCSDSNDWATRRVRTACSDFDLPWSENFDSISETVPECWTRVTSFLSSSTLYPYIYDYGSSHGKVLRMYTTATGSNLIATPRIGAPLNQLAVSFDAYRSSGTIEVGVMSNLSDSSTYQHIGFIDATTVPTANTWTPLEFYSDNTGITDSGYVVFRIDTVAASAYIDNLEIYIASDCHRPLSLTGTATGYYTASLHWSGIDNAASYTIRYGTSDELSEATDSVEIFGEDSTTLDNLRNGTTYYAWVRANCDASSSSEWRAMVAPFTTEVSCYPITNVNLVSRTITGAAFEWSFAGQGNPVVEVLCELEDVTDSTTTVAPTLGSTYHLISGLNPDHLYTVKFYTVCDPDTSVALSVSLMSDGDACKVIRGTSTVSYAPFYGLYNYSYCQMLYTGNDVSGLDTLTGIAFRVATTPSSYPQRPINVWIGNTPMTTVNSSTIMNQSQMIQVANNFQFDVSDTGWVTIPFSQPFVHTSGSNIMIAVQNLTGHYSSFSWGAHSTTTGGYTMWYTDSGVQSYASHTGTNNSSSTTMPDIKFLGNCGNHGSDSNLCAAPIVLLDSIDSTAAHIIWLSGTDETSWVAEYKAETDTAWTSDGLINGSEYTFTGLTPATGYIFRLGTVCEEDTVYSTELFATTECVYEHLPFHFTQADMVAIQTPGLSPCWNYSNFYRSSNTTYGVSYLYTYSTAGLLMLPAIADPLNSAQLRTHVAATSTSLTQMRVGVMESTGTITWVDTIDLPHAANVGDATEQVVYLDSYTGTGNRVVIGTTSSNYMYFHDLHVEEIESCRHVEDLTVDNVGDGTATVSWTAGEDQTQWLVYLNGVFVDTTTTPTYTFTDLDPVSDYTVMVRTLCSVGDTSRPALTSFSTPCATITAMPWSENFDSISSMTDLQCWNRYSGLFNETTGTATLTTTTAGWTTNTSAMGGSKHTKVNIYGTSCKYWLVTPAIALGDNATISLDVALTKYNTTTAPTEVSSDDRFYVLATTNNGNTWQVVEKWTSDSTTGGRIYENIPATAQHHTLSLSSYAGMTVRFAFYGESTVSGGDNDLHIDNIVVNSETIQHECDAPVINSANATRNEAVLTWTGTANSYEVAIVEGTWQAPDSGTAVTGTSHTFTGLDELTQYSVGVRAICDDAISDWVSRTVTTLSIDDVANASFSMRPNPATSMVTVEADAEALVAIIDMNGREVYRSDIASDKHHIDVSNLAKGAYFVRVTTQDGTSVRKLIVK